MSSVNTTGVIIAIQAAKSKLAWNRLELDVLVRRFFGLQWLGVGGDICQIELDVGRREIASAARDNFEYFQGVATVNNTGGLARLELEQFGGDGRSQLAIVDGDRAGILATIGLGSRIVGNLGSQCRKICSALQLP